MGTVLHQRYIIYDMALNALNDQYQPLPSLTRTPEHQGANIQQYRGLQDLHRYQWCKLTMKLLAFQIKLAKARSLMCSGYHKCFCDIVNCFIQHIVICGFLIQNLIQHLISV
jgi:hypothetical protein